MPGQIKSSHINTGMFGALDFRVWITMILFTIVCTGLLSYKLLSVEPCPAYDIQTRTINGVGNEVVTGETIRFTASAGSNKMRWDFGDGVSLVDGMSVVSHSYKKQGRYNVIADHGGGCRQSVAILVKAREVSFDEWAAYPNNEAAIISESSTTANKGVVFISNEIASTYEWTVLNRNEFNTQYGKIVSFTFPLPGTYTIQLKLDKDRKRTFVKNVYVLAGTPLRMPTSKPPKNNFAFQPLVPEKSVIQPNQTASSPTDTIAKIETNTVKRQFLDVPDAYIKRSLENVMDGSKTMEDFADLLCNGSQTHVLLNDAKDFITFEELCKKIEHKKYKIESLKAARNNENNRCVLVLNIAIRRKGLFGRSIHL
ncbi:PKD domain-containing protein [Segetibacter sp. 3557_3]|uniref:PKD domain-containing protein n=1 Tax=Segetibacter sp. 3557_3 TaxID=2547429 RepID=UPI001058A3F1|nr:PKD domain-containing protein [Segetibacter sp. 3557_3]TDH28057.1 PKD domain-containing protein [Segetibacter sp. 3557_3]